MKRRKPEDKLYRVAVGGEPADRPVAPLRSDLLISPQLFYGQLCFVVKDPVTLRYFRLQPIEHHLIAQFDGKRTARDLHSVIMRQYPECTLTVQDVLRFVGMLHESHLLVGEGIAHAEWLSKQARKAKTKKFKELAQNFLFFKVPLFHPDKLLGFMDQTLGRVIFNPITGLFCVALVLFALWQVLMNTDRLASTPYNLLSWQNLIVLYGVFTVTKVFHEFGHGLAAKHHGAEVSSMGVMMFIVTPSFYCDTSDAWMLPGRAARLWINAGGIIVELVLAALATFVWLFTQPDSLVNQIALNVMISCSVATLFFNANPLLRYDGYYFLADYLELPNLMTKGRQLVGFYLQKYCLGLKPQQVPDASRPIPLVTFAIGSTIYRWVVVFSVIGLLYMFFDRYGMGPIGVMLAILYVALTVLWPMGRTMHFLWKQRWDVTKRLAYVSAAGAVGIGLLLAIALMPWSHRIREPLVVLSQSDEPIFVRTPGYVAEVHADVGQRVKAGDPIMTLRDPALDNLYAQAKSQRDQAELAASTAAAEAKPAAVAAAQEAVAAYNKQIALIEQRIADLSLRAPVDGTVVGDQPLKRIAGNYVSPGVKVCRVIRTDRLEARISLPQQQAALVKEDMPVKIRLWANAHSPIETRVLRVSSTISDQLLHPALASTTKGEVEVAADAQGQLRSTSPRSTVVIALPTNAPSFIADGMTGRGEITVQRTTVLGRLWRALLDTTTPDWHL